MEDTLTLGVALLQPLPLREGELLPEALRVAATVAGSVAESVAQALTEAVLQNDDVSDPHDEALGLFEALLLPLPLREDELQPELLRVATPVRQCVGEGVAQALTEEVLQ